MTKEVKWDIMYIVGGINMKYQVGDKVIINGEEKVIDGIYYDNYVIGKTLVSESEIVDTGMYDMIKSALKTMISNGDLKIDIENDLKHTYITDICTMITELYIVSFL